MKKLIFPITILVASLFTACHTDQSQTDDTTPRDFLDGRNPGVTQEDILRIATKYGLQDSVAEGYRGTLFSLPGKGAYPYMDPVYIDSFLAAQARALKSRSEYQVFETEKVNIKSVDDFFALIEKVPALYQYHLKEHGGMQGYQQYKESMKRDCDVYMGEDNSIVFSKKGDPYEYGRKLNKD